MLSSLKKWRWKIFHYKKKTFLLGKSYMWRILDSCRFQKYHICGYRFTSDLPRASNRWLVGGNWRNSITSEYGGRTRLSDIAHTYLLWRYIVNASMDISCNHHCYHHAFKKCIEMYASYVHLLSTILCGRKKNKLARQKNYVIFFSTDKSKAWFTRANKLLSGP